jgi:hypothetical protein
VPVSVVRPAAERSQAVARPRFRAGATAPWLVVCCYLLGAVALTWRLWADPAARSTVGDPGPADVDLFVWFLRYEATAVAHGHLPALVTTAMNAPRGINLMWNTSLLLPGTLLSPVTLLAGPQASLTVLMTLGFAGSAASLFWVLRRWGATVGAAALGGAIYGFSPAMLDSSIAHYHLQFAVLPPLIIDALLRLLSGRGKAVWNGAYLGLAASAQLLTGEELLLGTAVAAVVLVAVLAASRPRGVTGRARDALPGAGTAVAVALVICAYPLSVQFRGPLSEHGTPWEIGRFGNSLASFVVPPGGLLFHTPASAAAAASYPTGVWEYVAYLGWPLLVVLVFAAVRFWRDIRVRAAAVTWAVLEVLSLGGSTLTLGGFQLPGWLLPFHWLQGLPVIGQLLPGRLALVADGAAAAALAFALDLARSPVPGWRRRTIPAAVAVLAVLPLVPLPVQTITAAPLPVGWQAAFAGLRLAPGARVLVVPVPYSQEPQAIRWQADTGEPGSLIGGWFIGPGPGGQATAEYFGPPRTTAAVLYLDKLWAGSPDPQGLSLRRLSADLRYWRPAAVVAVTSPRSALGRLLTRLIGRPGDQAGGVLAWRL